MILSVTETTQPIPKLITETLAALEDLYNHVNAVIYDTTFPSKSTNRKKSNIYLSYNNIWNEPLNKFRCGVTRLNNVVRAKSIVKKYFLLPYIIK
jgi:hypothetical protein